MKTYALLIHDLPQEHNYFCKESGGKYFTQSSGTITDQYNMKAARQ